MTAGQNVFRWNMPRNSVLGWIVATSHFPSARCSKQVLDVEENRLWIRALGGENARPARPECPARLARESKASTWPAACLSGCPAPGLLVSPNTIFGVTVGLGAMDSIS